ncbi:MAG TPA: HD-GYP domain-containing protein [Phycisphaerales bacterium]|nr:HD-GYP domain-containing protein [Phycisphaerales bacterium]
MHRLEARDTDPHGILRERLERLGILTWRLASDGRVLRAPTAVGVRATWLCNPVLVELLRSRVPTQPDSVPPGPIELFRGCRVLLIPLRVRRRISEWTAAMFLTTDALHADEFLSGCKRAGVDPVATAKSLLGIADFTAAEASRMCALLLDMAADIEKTRRDAASLDGFTQTLADAYEHIELTYGLARAMRHLADPPAFLRMALQGLLDATRFGWDALLLTTTTWQDDVRRPAFLCAGRPPADEAGFQKFAAAVLPELDCEGGTLIQSDERVVQLIGAQEQVVLFPIARAGRPIGMILGGAKGGEDPQVSTYDTRVFDTVGAFVLSYLEIVSLLHEQQEMFVGSLRAITAAVDAKDSYTRGHSERVAHLAALLASTIGHSEPEVERIHIAGLMHDVGKIGVPEAVLCKAGKLTDEEFEAIKRHPRMGYEILRGIPQLADILPGVLWHHERFDGRGYPDGVAGEQIPLMARILALADTFDAMSSNRAYRPAMARDRVLEEIVRVSGSQFDPALAARFVQLDFAEYDRMVARHRPQRQHPPESLAA